MAQNRSAGRGGIRRTDACDRERESCGVHGTGACGDRRPARTPFRPYPGQQRRWGITQRRSIVTDVQHMKWWGWGVEGVGFHWEDKPGFAPFVEFAVGLDLHTAPVVGMPEFDKLTVAKSLASPAFTASLASVVGED